MPILTTRFPTTPYILRSLLRSLLRSFSLFLPLAFMPARTLSDDSNPALSPLASTPILSATLFPPCTSRSPRPRPHRPRSLQSHCALFSRLAPRHGPHPTPLRPLSPMHADRVYPGWPFLRPGKCPTHSIEIPACSSPLCWAASSPSCSASSRLQRALAVAPPPCRSRAVVSAPAASNDPQGLDPRLQGLRDLPD
ncbi:hypothetical protein A0H81_12863 [Grifola frondosa]|uniref:Uncharacterized protein n=1 Tax=Grifola frondosa TaxID=5627 RepID=A0A1C7LQK1_GRIFR|nr:hypothetical protein A0H81_12863 [Grifola frondosa]